MVRPVTMFDQMAMAVARSVRPPAFPMKIRFFRSDAITLLCVALGPETEDPAERQLVGLLIADGGGVVGPSPIRAGLRDELIADILDADRSVG